MPNVKNARDYHCWATFKEIYCLAKVFAPLPLGIVYVMSFSLLHCNLAPFNLQSMPTMLNVSFSFYC